MSSTGSSPDGRLRPVAEREYLADLLGIFGMAGASSIEDVFREVQARYDVLFAQAESMGLTVYNRHAELSRGPDLWVELALAFHRGLFDGLMHNAGAFRSRTDPGGGRVLFGIHHAHLREPRFEGTMPADIETALQVAFSPLSTEPDAVAASILAYQRFLRVHPFYDANGRIGRLLVHLFLIANGWLLDWELLDRHQGQFVQKLNHVHKRPDDRNRRDVYEGYLVAFWRRHVKPLHTIIGDG